MTFFHDLLVPYCVLTDLTFGEPGEIGSIIMAHSLNPKIRLLNYNIGVGRLLVC